MNQTLQEIAAEIRGMTEEQLALRITELQSEVVRLHDIIETLHMEGEFKPTDCVFCHKNLATTHTSADDYVCQSCKDEFEAFMEREDTDA